MTITRKIILLPSSFGYQERDPKIRAYLVGLVARACTIFRVSNIIIYPDPTCKIKSSHLEEFVSLLCYANTPQYLRKYLRYSRELSHAGVLQPLQAPHHPETGNSVEYRYGWVKSSSKAGSLVDLGLKRLWLCPKKLLPNKILLFRVNFNKTLCYPLGKNLLETYLGYDVEVSTQNLTTLLEKLKSEKVLLIGSSKYGVAVEDIARVLAGTVQTVTQLGICFGSYLQCFYEWLPKEEVERLFDFIVNIQSTQGTKTIRTEEAIFLALEIIDFMEKLRLG
jgi:hypothetical protein